MRAICTVDQLLSPKRNAEDLEVIMRMQASRMRVLLDNSSVWLTERQLEEVQAAILEFTDIPLTIPQVRQIMDLSPELRINARLFPVNGDTETRSLLVDTLAAILVGTEYEDDSRLLELMQSQAAVLFPQPTVKDPS